MKEDLNRIKVVLAEKKKARAEREAGKADGIKSEL